MWTDTQVIALMDDLNERGLINARERSKLVTQGGRIVDDSRCPVEALENGDVYIHGRGAYPVILVGYMHSVVGRK